MKEQDKTEHPIFQEITLEDDQSTGWIEITDHKIDQELQTFLKDNPIESFIDMEERSNNCLVEKYQI